MKLHSIILFLLCLLFQSCEIVNGPKLPDPPKPPKIDPPQTAHLEGEPAWYSMDDVKRDLGSKAKISGKVVDLRGNCISGDRIKKPKNRQDESAIGLRNYISGLIIKNGIIRDFPGGIWNKADDVAFEDILFINIGEDAVSTAVDEATGFRLTRCRFYAGKPDEEYDKIAQLNAADGAVIEDCYFAGGITSIRLQKKSTKHKNITARVTGNTFDTARTAINVDGPTTVYQKGNIFKNIIDKWVLGSDAKVINLK